MHSVLRGTGTPKDRDEPERKNSQHGTLHTAEIKFHSELINLVYYESMKRKLKIKPIYECRCNERLQTTS